MSRRSVATEIEAVMAGSKRKQSSAKLASKVSAEKPVKRENVFLFVPNLIVLYCISCLLDAFDGMFARMLNQSSRFGAVLDMVTDRCTTACLLCFLTATYPSFALLFQGLVTLDFSSHYIHMYTYVAASAHISTLVSGSSSHKKVDSKTSRILSLYYTNTRVLFLFCAANELFFVCLYLMDFYKQPLGLQVAPFLPQSLLQVAYAQKKSLLFRIIYVWIPSLTWPQLLGAFTFPICAGKQIINGVQFWKAAKALCDMDDMERRARSTRRT
ncbi:CDP-diacylglycerol--inositol 3-phosphatidyltransferase [Malassezia nana]|uniref:CDP-diacylglycerol--inositol 3-phosphatidyltransferase n=1 Tax=Malassezia nana TaxID=180528 RepID=A0AAF0ESD4_9BASI|nr:CDP-diacylglycerol--inositol 3-phosphatidyltransferase [Malassezia nana]